MTFNEKTLVPISFISVVVVVTIWLTTVSNKTDANASQIAGMKQDHIRDNDEIKQELRRINDKIDILLKR